MEPPPKGEFNAGIPIQGMSGANPTAQALGNLGQSIKGLGDLAADLEAEQERQDLTDAEIIMRDAAARLQNKLAGNPNYREHQDIAAKTFDDAKMRILGNDNLSVRSQKMLEERMNLFIKSKIEKVGLDAKLMQVEYGRRLHMAKVDMHRESGDTDMAKQAIDDGVGVYYPEEFAELQKMAIDRDEKNENLLRAVEDGDVGFIEGSALPDSDKRRMIEQAKTSQKRAESIEVNKIADAIASGKIMTEDDLVRNLEGAPNVSEEMAQKFLRNWQNQKPLTFAEETSMLDRMNGYHDDLKSGKIGMEEYRQKLYNVQMEANTLGNRMQTPRIKDRLRELNPDEWVSGSADDPKANGDASTMIKKMSAAWSSKGGYGESESAGESIDAVLSRELTEKAMMEWLKSLDHEPTPDEIKAQFMKEATNSMTDIDLGSFDADPIDDLENILAGDTILPKQ